MTVTFKKAREMPHRAAESGAQRDQGGRGGQNLMPAPDLVTQSFLLTSVVVAMGLTWQIHSRIEAEGRT